MDSYIQIAWRDRVFVDDFVNDRRNILADEWFFAGQHLIKNYAQAEEVRPSIQLAAFYLLGGHVVRRAQHLPGIGDLPAGLGNAKVHDLYRAVPGNHDVGRFYVAMNNSVGMRVIQPAANLPRKLQHFFRRQDALFRQQFMQRGAFNELHGDVENSVLLAGVINGNDVGMIEDARRARFILETAHHFLRVQSVDVEPHRFKRYGPPDRRVQRLVHNAHGAATKLTGNLVSANRLNRHHEGLSFVT